MDERSGNIGRIGVESDPHSRSGGRRMMESESICEASRR
jgi:hypothetical protein